MDLDPYAFKGRNHILHALFVGLARTLELGAFSSAEERALRSFTEAVVDLLAELPGHLQDPQRDTFDAAMTVFHRLKEENGEEMDVCKF